MTSTPSSRQCTEPGTDINSIRTLLATAVDHAGLFPPAGLNMSAAVAAFHDHRHGEHAWMLGSFVVPAGRLKELAEAVEGLGAGALDPWPLSVVVASPEEGAEAMELVRRRLAHVVRVAAFEVRPIEAQTMREKHAHLSGQAYEGVRLYYEVPLDERTEARLDAVAAVAAHAKVRTGGVTADAFPARGALVRFMRACAERDLAFKATAGLHHPFPGSYPLTYEPASACARMHGFLSLALTAGLLRADDVDDAEAVTSLAGGAGDLVGLDDGLSWLGHRLAHADVVDLRRAFFHSFGSCSFSEPVEELREAGLLGSDLHHVAP
ncbi:MAG TPA: hypothetical protein VMM35_06235 [Longimicrobiales bacterium]|nr:hypothetical protein [Longimicrobiales bacterium]